MNIGWILLIFALIVLLLMAFLARQRREQSTRMSGLDSSARLDALDASLTNRDEVLGLARSGQKIHAIKRYQEVTGASLDDARSAVERLALKNPLSFDAQLLQSSEEIHRIGGEAFQKELESLLIQGKKIVAIKRYREMTGLGLREARDAVEVVEKALLLNGPTSFQSYEVPMETPREGPVVAEPNDAVRSLVFEGRKIEAIKLYREQTGLGLREAKDRIDLLERTWRYGMEQN